MFVKGGYITYGFSLFQAHGLGEKNVGTKADKGSAIATNFPRTASLPSPVGLSPVEPETVGSPPIVAAAAALAVRVS